MNIRNEPLLTQVFEDHTDFRPVNDSAYVALRGIEERSSHFTAIRGALPSVAFLDVVREGENDLDIQVCGTSTTERIRLRSRTQLADIWTRQSWGTVYLDITGLRHHIWIPLLRAALDGLERVRVVYVEPDRYKPSVAPTEGQIYDLSERIGGIAPIPGFAALSRTDDNFLFIPLLGFEGTRVAYLLEQVQPLDDQIIPVVGVPGFRPQHPFATYLGNRIALEESNAWRRVRFADANCPFSLFYLLRAIEAENKNKCCKIAVVGTKPHALGAALFVMSDSSRRELIYDHPIRKVERTAGIGRLLVYDVSEFHASK